MSELPLRRSYLEATVGRSAGIFQFGTRRLVPKVSAMSMLGVMAYAEGAALSDKEFDVWTWLCERYQYDRPDDRWLATSGSEIVREVYGTKGGALRQRAMQALDNLSLARVTLPGFDARTGEIRPTALSKVPLLGAVVLEDQFADFIAAHERGEKCDFASVATLRGSTTVMIQLPEWVADNIADDEGSTLDRDVQRRLAGAAKRIWAQLAGLAYVELAKTDEPDREALRLELTDDQYEAFGMHHARRVDRRRYTRQALERILDADPTYVELALEVGATGSGSDVLWVVRATGADRQRRLRERLRGDQGEQQVLAA